jgi:hypothetical protein
VNLNYLNCNNFHVNFCPLIQHFSVNHYQTVSEKRISHTKSQSHKENNHRAHREHRESFSAIVPFFSKPSEKHECFSEGLLKKGKPGGEAASGLSTGQSWLKRLIKQLCALGFLCGLNSLFALMK